MGDTNKPTIILIHGSPGSWDAWVDMITSTNLLENYHVVAMDRAGYNKTTIAGKYSLKEQSDFLKPVMNKYCSDCIIAGHSYGGGLAVQVGLDYQSLIKGTITIAGTVAAPYQKLKWYNYAMKYSPARWLVAPDFVVSDNEMWALQNDLPKLEKQLVNYTRPMAIIQGNKDMLVNKNSAQYLNDHLTNAKVELFVKDNMNHFVIWSDKDLVIQALDWIKEQ